MIEFSCCVAHRVVKWAVLCIQVLYDMLVPSCCSAARSFYSKGNAALFEEVKGRQTATCSSWHVDVSLHKAFLLSDQPHQLGKAAASRSAVADVFALWHASFEC